MSRLALKEVLEIEEEISNATRNVVLSANRSKRTKEEPKPMPVIPKVTGFKFQRAVSEPVVEEIVETVHLPSTPDPSLGFLIFEKAVPTVFSVTEDHSNELPNSKPEKSRGKWQLDKYRLPWKQNPTKERKFYNPDYKISFPMMPHTYSLRGIDPETNQEFIIDTDDIWKLDCLDKHALILTSK